MEEITDTQDVKPVELEVEVLEERIAPSSIGSAGYEGQPGNQGGDGGGNTGYEGQPGNQSNG
jgi:hypothetical protein